MGTLSFREGSVLYKLIKEIKPETVVETGCLNGVSSYYILQALSENKKGKLYTIDYPAYKNNVEEIVQGTKKETRSIIPDGRSPGWLVPLRLRNRWEYVQGKSVEKLPEVLEKVGSIDLFLHDSDHSYENIMNELSLVDSNVRDKGFFAVDDFKRNSAAVEFCRNNDYVFKEFDGLMLIRKHDSWDG